MKACLPSISGGWRYSVLLLLVTLTVSLAGCGGGPKGPLQVKVTGKVDFEGEPVNEGRIEFRKTGDDGRAFSAPISGGYYEVMTEPGHMAVSITASRLIPGKFDNSNGTPEPVGEMYIPPQYNAATTLTAEVKKEGPNDFPFQLTKKKPS